MKILRIATAALLAVSVAAVVGVAASGNDQKDKHHRLDRIRGTLVGLNEVPSVSTAASGKFEATISQDEQSIEYELTFTGLQGVVAQSHIHIGQTRTNGGIVLWLCQGTARAPAQVAALTPECPQEGSVTGVLTAANVTPVATQQIGLNEFAEVIALMRAGAAYANVHTAPSPGGEIRAQLKVDDGRGHRD